MLKHATNRAVEEEDGALHVLVLPAAGTPEQSTGHMSQANEGTHLGQSIG